MGLAQAVVSFGTSPESDRLFHAIGHFLADQRLEPNPANFTFAYHILVDPDGPLARAVAALTDGGVRLTARDIGELGGSADPTRAQVDPAKSRDVESLVAKTQMQVEGFEDMVRSMHAEARGFGQDLAASAAAIHRSRESDSASMVDEVALLTASMIDRIHRAEARLEQATSEASELRSKLEEARDNARRDPLTDLPNRRAFEEAFSARAQTGEPVLIAVCDVDHFKSVNDRFGHAVGDRVLRAIGAELQKGCSGHLVARHGGEEFAVLFADIDRGAAFALLEAAREAVADKRYRLRETDAPLGEVTFSAGIAETIPGEDLIAAFQRADTLLYAAKNGGRNQVRRSW